MHRIYLAFMIPLALIALIFFNQKKMERSENDSLRAQVKAWQAAAMPAIRARGWEVSVEESTVTPDQLRYALNPCLTPAGGWFNEHECDRFRFMGQVPEEDEFQPPIKIVLDDKH